MIEEKAKKVDDPTARVALVDKLKIELDSAKIIVERVKNSDSGNPEVVKTVIKEPAVGPLVKSHASAKPMATNSKRTTPGMISTTTTTSPTTIPESNTSEISRFTLGMLKGFVLLSQFSGFHLFGSCFHNTLIIIFFYYYYYYF